MEDKWEVRPVAGDGYCVFNNDKLIMNGFAFQVSAEGWMNKTREIEERADGWESNLPKDLPENFKVPPTAGLYSQLHREGVRLKVGDHARHRGVKEWAAITKIAPQYDGTNEYVLIDKTGNDRFWGDHHIDYIVRKGV